MRRTSRRRRSASPAASRVIGPRKILTMAGNIPLGHHPLSGSGTPRVQAEQRLPVGRFVLDEDRNVAYRRTEIGRQGAQRLVNRLFERIVEPRLPTRIHLRNDATIGAGIVAASSNPDAVTVMDPFHVVALAGVRPHPVAPPRRHLCLLRPPRLQRTHRSHQRTARSFAPQRPRIPQTSPTTAGAHCCTAERSTNLSRHSELRRAR